MRTDIAGLWIAILIGLATLCAALLPVLASFKKPIIIVGSVAVALSLAVAAAGTIGPSAATPGDSPPPASSPTATLTPVVPPTPTPAPQPPPAALPGSVTVVGCTSPTSVHAGEQVPLTYTIQSRAAASVGVGAALYDDAKIDHSTGDGDEDSRIIPAGTSTIQRTVTIPAQLKPNRYEVTAEIWPPNHIGDGDTLADKSCVTFAVL